MKLSPKSIIFIGFTHVGKSVIAKLCAQRLDLPFIDLDVELERVFASESQQDLVCREIMQAYGEAYFRELEHRVLMQILRLSPKVIALGGGTPMLQDNQYLLQEHTLVHVRAEPELVFARIMQHGTPAFFPKDETPLIAFKRLWRDREDVYNKLASFAIDNDGQVLDAVDKIVQKLL
jgi:shikimate kinase